MDTKEEANALAKEVLVKIIECGTELDEYFRRFRELRVQEDRSPSFRSALINVEHAFFMVVQSINVLREQLKLLKVAAKKTEIE